MIDKIVMPSMGATGEDVVIAEWLVEGRRFRRGGPADLRRRNRQSHHRSRSISRRLYPQDSRQGRRNRPPLATSWRSSPIRMDEPLEDGRPITATPSTASPVPRQPTLLRRRSAIVAADRPYPSFALGPPTRQGARNRSGGRQSRRDRSTRRTFSQPRPAQRGRRAADARFRPCAGPSPCERSRARRKRPISTLRPAST